MSPRFSPEQTLLGEDWETGGATWINDNLSPMDSRDSKKILRAEFPNVQTKRFSAWKECLLKILRVTPVNKMKKQETARRQFTRKCTCRKTRSIWLSWSSPTSHKAISFPYLFGQHQKLLTSGQIRKKSLLRLQKRVHYMLITCKLKKPSTRSLRTDSQLERGESEPSATWRSIPQATLGSLRSPIFFFTPLHLGSRSKDMNTSIWCWQVICVHSNLCDLKPLKEFIPITTFLG